MRVCLKMVTAGVWVLCSPFLPLIQRAALVDEESQEEPETLF